MSGTFGALTGGIIMSGGGNLRDSDFQSGNSDVRGTGMGYSFFNGYVGTHSPTASKPTSFVR